MSSGHRVLTGTVRLPEHSCTNLQGTECSGATTCSPEHSLPSIFVWIFGEPSARELAHAAPSTLSRNLALPIVGGLGCSGVTGHLPVHFLPGTWTPRIIRVLEYPGATDCGLEHLLPGLGLSSSHKGDLAGRCHVADGWSGLGIQGPLVPDTSTTPELSEDEEESEEVTGGAFSLAFPASSFAVVSVDAC